MAFNSSWYLNLLINSTLLHHYITDLVFTQEMIPIEGKFNWACGSLPVCSPSPYWNVFLVRRLRQLKITSQVGNWPRKTRTLTQKIITILATRNVKKKEKIRLKGKIPPHRRNYLCWIRFTECLQNKCVFKTNCTLFQILYFLLLTKGKRNIWTMKDNTRRYNTFVSTGDGLLESFS